MPTINHPQRPESPLANLINIGAGISQIATGFKQRNLIEQEAEKNKASAEAAQRETAKEAALQKEKDDPDSPLSQQIKQVGAYRLSKISQILEKSGEDPGPLNQLAEKLNAPKEIQVEGQMPQGVEGPGLPQKQVNPNYSPITGTQAEALLNSPQIKGLETLAEAKLKGEYGLQGKKLSGEYAVEAAGKRAAPLFAGVQQRQIRTQSSANNDYSREMKPFENTILAANRAHEIVERIKKGELKSTPTLSLDLSNALASMFNNGKAATVYGAEHSKLSSLEGDAAARYGYTAGKAVNTLAPQQLDQLDKDILALRDEYSTAHKGVYDSWKEGIDPSLLPALDKRFSKFRETSVNRSFGGQSKYHEMSDAELDAQLKAKGLAK